MDTDLELKQNFLSADKKVARNSYGDFYKVGDKVGHDGEDATATIYSFSFDDESAEVNEHKIVGTVEFQDEVVNIYYDPTSPDPNTAMCAWKHRNPDSFYQGYLYMDADGKITYPEDAVIPEQTDRDRELIPKFVIIGKEEVTDFMKENIKVYLESEHNLRNRKRI